MSRFLDYSVYQSAHSSVIFAIHFVFLAGWPFIFPMPFHFLQFIFSIALSSISSPSSSHPPNLNRSIFFLISSAFSPFGCALCLYGFSQDFARIGLRGFFIGSIYAFHYLFKRRWVLEFPIIQRPTYFNFKMGIPLAVKCAFKFSTVAFIFSAVFLDIIPHPFKCSIGTPAFFAEQIVFFVASFTIFLCWELSHNIHRVVYTERSVFAAETNPCEHLLLALEKRNPTSLSGYLAYLDLCMVWENNVDTWWRAAFFEESGETYKREIAVCLRPLEQLTSRLGEVLGNSAEKPTNLSNPLSSPTDVKHLEELSNAAVVSTLISCLLAVENFKWATANSGRLDIATATGKRKNGPANSKAYAIADVLKTSIYQIVSAFHDEMLAGTKASLLEKDWIKSEKPLFGSREMLIQKLRLFLDFRAS
ncbi:hypothetical protein TSUD_275340 [Trifolium subterraneum]|uniref:Nucleoporin protein Ndc1-Nup n=1 Tax=Trifolium subterraneum TaxID=3900 RepID=A0A2Z6NUB8_TRISU|nr:hypothetical protein TSUD_275340 [Trifolium subterraneum]